MADPKINRGDYTPSWLPIQGAEAKNTDGSMGLRSVNGLWLHISGWVQVIASFDHIGFVKGVNIAEITLPPGLPADHTGLGKQMISGVFDSDMGRNLHDGSHGRVVYSDDAARARLIMPNINYGSSRGTRASCWCEFSYRTTAM